MVGRWGLPAEGGRGGLEVEGGLDDGRGGGRTGGDKGGRSGLCAAGGGGGGRGGVRGGGESRGSRFRVVLLLVSGRLWVRPVLLGCSVADIVCAVAGSEVTTSVRAGGSEVVALEISDEPPAAESKNHKV